MPTFFLSSVNADWLPVSVEPVVLGLALFYGGIVQVFAGMWEFAKGNTFLVAVFSLLFVTFVFLTLGKLMPSTAMTTVGGYFGLLTAAGAWYGSMAGVTKCDCQARDLAGIPTGLIQGRPSRAAASSSNRRMIATFRSTIFRALTSSESRN